MGYQLCVRLHQAGARLLVADIDENRVARAVREFDAQAVHSQEIHAADADVFAPCALGGILTAETIGELRARVVAGSANNQLLEPDCADRLAASGVLYAPDYVINAGGVISVAGEYLGIARTGGESWVQGRIAGIRERLDRIFVTADQQRCSTDAVAEAMARKVLRAGGSRWDQSAMPRNGRPAAS